MFALEQGSFVYLTMLCCFSTKTVEQDLLPCKCYPVVNQASRLDDISKDSSLGDVSQTSDSVSSYGSLSGCHGNLSDNKPTTSAARCLSDAVITPVAIILHNEDTLSALPARPDKTRSGGRRGLRRTQSLDSPVVSSVKQRSLSVGSAGTSCETETSSVLEISNLSRTSSTETSSVTESSHDLAKEKGDELPELSERKISYSRYVSSDIEDLKARKTSLINYSSGYAVRLK